MTGKRNAIAFEISGDDDPRWKDAGAFWFDPGGKGLSFACPCGCGAVGGVSFLSNGWSLTDHGAGKISVTPSIGFGGNYDSPKGSDGYHWHGYLTNGVFEER